MTKRISIIFTIVALIFSLIISSILYFNKLEDRKDLIDEISSNNIENLVLQYNAAIKDYRLLIETISSNLSLDVKNKDFSFIIEQTKEIKRKYNFFNITVADMNGVMYTDIDILDWNAREFQRPWFMEIVEDKSSFYRSPLYKDLTTNQMVITFSTPIIYQDELLGVFAIDVLGDQFLHDDNQEFVLSSKNGTIIATNVRETTPSLKVFTNIYEARPILKTLVNEPIVYQSPDDGSWFSAAKFVLNDGNILFSFIPQNRNIDRANKDIIIMVGLIFIFSLILCTLLFFILKKEFKNIQLLKQTILDMSNGRFNSFSMPRSNNEIDEIADSLQLLRKNLTSFIKASHNTMNGLDQEQQKISEVIIENKKNSYNEMTSTEKVSSAALQLSSSATEVAKNAVNATDATSTAMNVISDSSETLRRSKQIFEQMNNLTTDTASTVNNLRSHSQKINSVVDVISNISDQTNLLALNAAIEAARAGQHGRGFAVVATEVRELSLKTQQSTIDIQNLIADLQEQSLKADDAMAQNLLLMIKFQSMVDELTKAFSSISEQVQTLSNLNELVTTSAGKQSTVTHQISKQLEEINELVQNNLKGVEKTKLSNESISDIIKKLSDELSFFKV